MSAHRRAGDAEPDRRRQPTSQPPDALDPPAQQHPRSDAEAAADEAMAAAEGDVARHAGSPDQLTSVQEMALQRGQEDRRRTWMDRHDGDSGSAGDGNVAGPHDLDVLTVPASSDEVLDPAPEPAPESVPQADPEAESGSG